MKKLKRFNKWESIKAIETSLDSVNNSSWGSIGTYVWIDSREPAGASILNFVTHFVKNSVMDLVDNCMDHMDELGAD